MCSAYMGEARDLFQAKSIHKTSEAAKSRIPGGMERRFFSYIGNKIEQIKLKLERLLKHIGCHRPYLGFEIFLRRATASH